MHRLATDQPSLSPACKLCDAPIDSIEHVMVACPATSEVRFRLIPDLMTECCLPGPAHVSNSEVSSIHHPSWPSSSSTALPSTFLTQYGFQFIPGISNICKVSRDWCFAVSRERSRLHKQLALLKATTTEAATFKKWQLLWCAHKQVLCRMIVKTYSGVTILLYRGEYC